MCMHGPQLCLLVPRMPATCITCISQASLSNMGSSPPSLSPGQVSIPASTLHLAAACRWLAEPAVCGQVPTTQHFNVDPPPQHPMLGAPPHFGMPPAGPQASAVLQPRNCCLLETLLERLWGMGMPGDRQHDETVLPTIRLPASGGGVGS